MPPHPASAEEEHQVSSFQGVFHSDTQQPAAIQGAPAGKQQERGGAGPKMGENLLCDLL